MNKDEFLKKLENDRKETAAKLARLEAEIKMIWTMTKEEWDVYKQNKRLISG